ncbi:MAG: arginine--tRNA ligase, partial [Limnochordia bacterium]
MDFIAEQREKLGELLKRTVEKCIAAGLLKVEPVDEVYLEIPRSVEHGHLATNLALTLSKEAGLPPRQVAQILLEQLDYGDLPVAKGEVAGPGFINFHLDEAWWGKLLRGIIEKGAKYGQRDGEARRERIQLEFVSANPTGPMNVVNARAAAVGDSLARLLKAIGYQVEKEFYVNDAGAQANQFARSLEARYLQLQGQEAEVPADGYPGEYVRELAEELAREHPQLAEMDPEERLAFFQREGLDRMVQWQRADLEAFGVVFDHWYREKTLHQAGKVEQVVKDLQAKGFVYEEDGALWFASTRFGDDKDRVVVRKEGMPTYLAADIAYHQDKFNRGFHKVIDIWGPDHHGYIAR